MGAFRVEHAFSQAVVWTGRARSWSQTIQSGTSSVVAPSLRACFHRKHNSISNYPR